MKYQSLFSKEMKTFSKIVVCCTKLIMLLLTADFFKINFFKNFFNKHIIVSNILDPDQDQCSIGPDLGLN